ncbi:hypothetical protein GDO86_007232, partial [Hymenochirus boettgeri]
MAKEVTFLESRDEKAGQYGQRDLRKTFFFKVACKTFGPPKSRTRQIIAPSMEKLELGISLPEGGLHGVPSITYKDPGDLSQEGTLTKSCSDWISERKEFRSQLDNMGDLKKWMKGKCFLNELESRVEQRITEKRSQSHMSFFSSYDMIVSGISQNAARSNIKSAQSPLVRPSIQQPNPEYLGILDQYLRKRHLRLVDLYNQTDKRKIKKISSNDLKAVRKEAAIPASDLQIDNLVISLSNKDSNYINYKDLSRGRYQWKMQNRNGSEHQMPIKLRKTSILHVEKEQDVAQLGAVVSDLKDEIGSSQDVSLPCSRDQSEGNRSPFLQVPLVNLGERRPLSYEDMEDIGKDYRETKRKAKSNTRLLEWLEQCRVVRTGDVAVDSHSVPSTLEDEMGELTDKYRRHCLQQYHQILKLCQSYGLYLSESLMEKALLYPGDKLICNSGQHLHLRQPGTVSANRKDFTACKPPKMRCHKSGQEARSYSRKVNKQSSIVIDMNQRIHSTVPYPLEKYVKQVRSKVRGKAELEIEPMKCWITYEQFLKMISNVRKRHPHCFLTTEDNAFWPGQLLDKLCIYLPEKSQKEPTSSV